MLLTTILVPLDGSAVSHESLSSICHLFDPQRYKVTVLRVADPPAGVLAEPIRTLPINGWGLPEFRSAQQFETSRHPIYPLQSEASLEAELEAELLDQSRSLIDAGFSVQPVVRFGDPAEEIVAYAENNQVDMIAMATHGRAGISRLLVGSVAERVLRASPVPVLLIRPTGQRGKALEQVAVASTQA